MRLPTSLPFDPTLMGKRIRAERCDLKYTLRGLARRLDIDAGVLSRIENGETLSPLLMTLLTLADFFDVSLDYLVGRSEVRVLARCRKRAA